MPGKAEPDDRGDGTWGWDEIKSLLSSRVMMLITTLNAEAIHAAHRAIGDGEYRQPRIIPPHAVADFVAEIGDRLVPPPREILFRAGLVIRGFHRQPDHKIQPRWRNPG